MRNSARDIARISFSRFRHHGIIGFALMLLFAVCPPLLAQEFKLGDIEITQPWSRVTPTGAKVAGGFFTIKNHGSTPDRLVAVTGAITKRAEIHEMAVDAAGVMTMRPLTDGLEIPAGGEVALKPGSFHVMFMDIEQGTKEGETFKGTLTFEKAGTIDVEFAVRAMGGMNMNGGHGSGHQGG